MDTKDDNDNVNSRFSDVPGFPRKKQNESGKKEEEFLKKYI